MAQSGFPKSEEGFYHLTPAGWQRKDHLPFPADRLETWRFQSETLAEDAKEMVHLTRLWTSHASTPEQRDQLRARFGNPVRATPELHLTIDCRD